MNVARFVLAFATLVVAAPTVAQDYRLLVTRGESFGIDEGAMDDITEESAYLSEDFGGFVVSRWYQLPETQQIDLAGCGADSSCYVNQLFDSQFDYVLVVNAYDQTSEVAVRYLMIDTRVGILAAETSAYLPTVTDFAYLLAPCHDALKVTPNWIDPGPVVTLPDPGTPPPQTAPSPVVTPPPASSGGGFQREPRYDLGQLGRIGAYTAGGGAALAVGGVLLGFGADETQQEIQAEPHTQERLDQLQRKGQSQQRMANAFLIVGGVAIVGGITLVVVDKLGRDDDGPDLSLGTHGTDLWFRASF